MKKVLLSLFLISLIFSCKSDDSEPESPLLLLKEIWEDGTLTNSYEYNSDSTLSRALLHNSDDIYKVLYRGDTVLYERYNDGILIESKTYYNFGDNVRSDQFDSSNQLEISKLYKFTGNSCGYNEIELFNEFGGRTSRQIYNYTDDCDAFITVEDNSGGIIIRSTTRRDDSNWFRRSIAISLLRQPAIGNINEVTIEDENQEVVESDSFSSIYEYNEENYPISETRTYLDGVVKEYAFTYYE